MSTENDENSQFTACCNKAEAIALRLIARAEQNSLGLTTKLEKKGFDPQVAKTVISGLLDRGLLNDERYAELWLRSRLLKKTESPKNLFFSLMKRGIDRNSAKKALEKVLEPDTEYALILKFAENPGKSKNLKYGKKLPLKALLKYEGFSAECINRYFDLF